MITAKAATRKYQTGNDPPLSWARVVANGTDSETRTKIGTMHEITSRKEEALFKGQMNLHWPEMKRLPIELQIRK